MTHGQIGMILCRYSFSLAWMSTVLFMATPWWSKLWSLKPLTQLHSQHRCVQWFTRVQCMGEMLWRDYVMSAGRIANPTTVLLVSHESVMHRVWRTYTHSIHPLILNTLEQLVKGKLKEAEYGNSGQPFQVNTSAKSQRLVVVFVIGGTTYEEAKAIADLNIQVCIMT